MKKKLVLASKSPRRRELLVSLGLDFEVITADTYEALPDGIAPDAAVMLLSERKASDVAKNERGSVVIGSDTVVYLPSDSIILGKPKDRADAERMLRLMSGKTHSVYTGVTVISDGKITTACERTDVTFAPLTDEELADYVSTGEGDDKAGAYGIQGLGGVFITKISGDYFNVTGMPKALTYRLLYEAGIDVLKENKQK